MKNRTHWVAGAAGFEPTMPPSKGGALPLGYTPISSERRDSNPQLTIASRDSRFYTKLCHLSYTPIRWQVLHRELGESNPALAESNALPAETPGAFVYISYHTLIHLSRGFKKIINSFLFVTTPASLFYPIHFRICRRDRTSLAGCESIAKNIVRCATR